MRKCDLGSDNIKKSLEIDLLKSIKESNSQEYKHQTIQDRKKNNLSGMSECDSKSRTFASILDPDIDEINNQSELKVCTNISLFII